jgi:hypothetical protein
VKNSSSDQVKELLRIHGAIENRTDPAVAEGIRRVHEWLLGNPSGSLSSKKIPLLSVLREEIDLPFDAFAMRIGFNQFCFSEQLTKLRTDIIDLLKDSYGNLLLSTDEEQEVKAYLNLDRNFPGFKDTIDSLVWLSYLCCSMDGPTETVVIAHRLQSGVQFDIKTGKKRTRHSNRRPSNIPIHRFFNNGGWHLCELCSNMTEHARESIEISKWAASHPAIAEQALTALRNGARLSLPQYSAAHCKFHSSQTKKNATYRRAVRRLEYYYAMRAFLIIVRKISRRGINILADRAVAFAFVNECPDNVIVKAIPSIVDKFESERYGVADSNPWAQEVLSHMEKMYLAFKKNNHPYVSIAMDYLSGSKNIYANALELGIIPRDVDENLRVVWPEMFHMLENGKAAMYLVHTP